MQGLGRFTCNLTGAIIKTFTVMKFWNWFLVPSLNVKDISFVNAWGVVLCAALLTYQLPPQNLDIQETDSSKNLRSLTHILWPAILLLGGWVVHQFQ